MRIGFLGGGLCLWALLGNVLPGSEAQIRFPQGSRFPQPMSPRPIPPKRNREAVGCNCLPNSECPPGFGQLSIICLTENGGKGVCCIPQEGVVITRAGFGSSSDVQPLSIPTNVISTGYQTSETYIRDVKRQERERFRSGEYLQRGDPARGHAYFFTRTPSSRETHELALTIAQSSIEIAQLQHLSAQQSFFGLPEVRLGAAQRGFECPINNMPRCDFSSKYRTIDGSCNNVANPILGKSETTFARLSQPLYGDGIMSVRANGVDGQPLPNPRIASNTILLDLDVPDSQHTLGVMQWSQFMDHDLTLTPFDDMDGQAIRCCRDGRHVNPMPASCFPISISPNDGFFGSRGQTCINFVRSMLALRENCALGPVEQMDILTHYIDGSMIYGSTEGGEFAVVDRTTGFMRMSNNNLPPINSSIDCEARNTRFSCFAGGDSRISEQPGLTTMHTLWVREHNRIASFLKRLNPRWNPTTLYQETRRIVIGQVQHIAFSEWLPIIIGKSLMKKLGINVLKTGYRSTYDPTVDPRMFNEFATAAFRYGHSLVQGLFRLITNTGRSSSIRLRDAFNAPDLLQRTPELVDHFVRSLSQQNIQTLDSLITQELSNHLFQTPAVDFGMDLMSLNLQRGRDHAIATYNQMRDLFGVGKATNFVDLLNTTPDSVVKRIQTVYRNVDDIDLFIGGITEKSISDGILGPTFSNIIGRQFKNAMQGDRYFYDNGGQAGSFTPGQLQEIRKSSIAKIYCENSNVGQMQPFAFSSPNNKNPVLPCDQVPGINLELWRG